jgi:hypothetical protein
MFLAGIHVSSLKNGCPITTFGYDMTAAYYEPLQKIPVIYGQTM